MVDSAEPPELVPLRKQVRILSELRREITDGLIPPGARLPTRDALSVRFQASRVTVQRALDQLHADGFVHSNRRGGTRVTPHPPHLSHFCLVFPSTPSGNWVLFWTAMCNEVHRLQQPGVCEISTHFGIDGRTDSEDYLRLLEIVESRRLAGIIFASSPHMVANTPLLNPTQVPCAVVGSRSPGQGIPAVTVSSFLEKAIDYMKERGRKQLAFILAPGQFERNAELLAARVNACGMQTRPYWFQYISPSTPESAHNIAHLLMHDPTSRPDGVIIGDDNLVASASAGLIAAGVRLPEDLDVVAHCNFPLPSPTILPVKRLGYDAGDVLKRCIELIRMRRQGLEVPELSTIQARFENDDMR